MTGAPSPPKRRGCLRALLAVLALVVLALLAAAASPALRWSLSSLVSPSPDEAAWSLVPNDARVVAALDVRALLGSPIAREIRPEIEAACRAHGLDLAWTERNARLLVLSSDGRGFATGAASGTRLSPLLLPRFDERWRPAGGAPGAVTDGSSLLRPMAPGLVAWSVSEAGEDSSVALDAALKAAAAAPHPPVALDGASLVVRVRPDDLLRRRMSAGLPRQAALYAASLQDIEARATAGETLDAVVRLRMSGPDAAALLQAQLRQLDTLLRSGLASMLAPLLGDGAGLVAMIPPFTVGSEGEAVVVTMSADASRLRLILEPLAKPRAAGARRRAP